VPPEDRYQGASTRRIRLGVGGGRPNSSKVWLRVNWPCAHCILENGTIAPLGKGGRGGDEPTIAIHRAACRACPSHRRVCDGHLRPGRKLCIVGHLITTSAPRWRRVVRPSLAPPAKHAGSGVRVLLRCADVEEVIDGQARSAICEQEEKRYGGER